MKPPDTRVLEMALEATGIVQPVKVNRRGPRIDVLCRLLAPESTLVNFLTDILRIAEANNLSVHVCKQFVLKDNNIVFGWNFSVVSESAKGLTNDINTLVSGIAEATPPKPVLKVVPQAKSQPKKPTSPYSVQAAAKSGLEIASDPKMGSGIIGRVVQEGKYGPLTTFTAKVGQVLPGSRISVLRSEVKNGVVHSVSSMPLPHVTRDMGAPKPGKEAGAYLPGQQPKTIFRRG